MHQNSLDKFIQQQVEDIPRIFISPKKQIKQVPDSDHKHKHKHKHNHKSLKQQIPKQQYYKRQKKTTIKQQYIQKSQINLNDYPILINQHRQSNSTVMSSNSSLNFSKQNISNFGRYNKKSNAIFNSYNQMGDNDCVIIQSRKKMVTKSIQQQQSNEYCKLVYVLRIATILLILICFCLPIITFTFIKNLIFLLCTLFLVIPYYYMIQTILNINPNQHKQYKKQTLNQHNQHVYQYSLLIPYYPNYPINYSKICKYCHIWQNSKVSHCSRCQVCHIGFDHYCTWLGSCIHQGNYQYFIRFVISVTVLFLLLIGFNIGGIVFNKYGDESIAIYVIFIVGLVQSLLSFIFCMYVLVYQLWVRSKGMTTKQYFYGQLDMPQNSLLYRSICLDNTLSNIYQSQDIQNIDTLNSTQKQYQYEKYTIENNNLNIIKLRPILIDNDSVVSKSQVTNRLQGDSQGQQQCRTIQQQG